MLGRELLKREMLNLRNAKVPEREMLKHEMLKARNAEGAKY